MWVLTAAILKINMATITTDQNILGKPQNKDMATEMNFFSLLVLKILSETCSVWRPFWNPRWRLEAVTWKSVSIKINVLWGLIYHCANFHTSTQNCRVLSLRSLTNCAISCKFVKFTRFLELRVRGNILVFDTLMEYTTHAYYISLDREMNEEHFDMQ